VLNDQELANGKSSIPQVRERGPFVYEEKLEKRNIKFSEDGTFVTYTPVFTLYFNRGLSVASDSEQFMFLNIPLLVILMNFSFI